jgi:low affinity Fe/Cu permease
MTFDEIGDRLEKYCAHPLALPIFTVIFLAGLWIIGVDATNIAVSYFTIALLLLSLGRDRREKLATQAKLDDLVEQIPEADSSKAGLEKKTEDEIKAAALAKNP